MVDKEMLIELVRERVALWDQRDKQYHNRDLRSKLWEEVGNVLNTDGEEASKQWQLLRDMFRKKIKESKSVSGTAAAKPKWYYFEALSFLSPMMKSRATSGNLSVSDTLSTQHPDEHGEDFYTENDPDLSTEQFAEPEGVTEVGNAHQPKNTSTFTNDPEDSKPPRLGTKRKRALLNQNEALDIERFPKLPLMEARFETPQTNSSLEDDDLSFFKSLLPSLKKLPDIRKMKLRSKILNWVIDELEIVEATTDRMWRSTTGTTQPPRCPLGSGYYSGYCDLYESSSDTCSPVPSPTYANC